MRGRWGTGWSRLLGGDDRAVYGCGGVVTVGKRYIAMGWWGVVEGWVEGGAVVRG